MTADAKGKVYLVGAGPGDPGLITLRGAECLAAADVVLYDSLANPALLDLAPPGAERRLVGKRQGKATASQEEIDRMIVDAARSGKTVVRLKGGDPFVFGRGAEEAEVCHEHGVSFEVVPGVTSAIAVPAHAGIPVTHRDFASAVTIVTGRPGDSAPAADPNWKALAAIGGTIVWLMAITRAGEIAGALIEAGLPAATPAAAIRWGTTPRQRTVTGSLGDIARRIEEEGLRPPGVLVVGRVAGLRDRLGWFERLPLFGRRIVVTRARHQAGEFARALERLGAHVLLHPTIEIRPPSDDAPLEAALARLSSYDWLVLTSANGVERFFGALLERDHDIRELAGVQVAAIGPATAAAVRRRGLRVDAVPGEFRAEALLEAIGAVDGKRILLARALVAREVLPDELRKRGAEVDVVPVYETIVPEGASTLSALEDADLVTFTSSSTVSNFLRAGGAEARALLERVAIAAIGPITAETIRQEGFEVAVMPREYTIAALTGAIADYFANRKRAK